MRLDAEAEVAQDLRPEPVAQAHVLESDHAVALPARDRGLSDGFRRPAIRPAQR